MKKMMIGLLPCLLCLVLLSACGIPKPPQEAQIVRNLPNEIKTLVIEHRVSDDDRYISRDDFVLENPPDVYEMDVESVSIEKRQTNEKEDLVYCTVKLKNAYYRCTKYLQLCYNYYDEGGWILDDWSETSPSTVEVTELPITRGRIAQIAGENDTNIDPEAVEADLENGIIRFPVKVEDFYNNGRDVGTVVVTCRLDGTTWKYDKNVDDIRFVWDLVGRWEYSKIEEDWGGTYESVIDLTIENFDQDTLSMDGTWNMRYKNPYPYLPENYATTISLDDTERVAITEDWSSIRIYDKATNSSVRFYKYKDAVEARYGGHFTAELVRE